MSILKSGTMAEDDLIKGWDEKKEVGRLFNSLESNLKYLVIMQIFNKTTLDPHDKYHVNLEL